MALLNLGLSHHSAPVEVRSRLAFADGDVPAALARLRALPGIAESAIVSTCNRTEIFAMTEAEDGARIVEWWRREREAPEGVLEKHLYTHRDFGAVQHSLRVASGLDSMILGEPQILGQMKGAFAQAAQVKSLGPVLSRLFQHSFAVAKLVRSSTEIGAHPVTMAYAAVQMARRIFADFHNATALLVGAGEIGTLIAKHLQGQGIGRLVVVNRSLERAERLAREVRGYAVSLNDLGTYLTDADIVISSTGARGHVIERSTMERAIARRRRKPVFMIDLAVPRDIDPRVAELEDIYLYTVDDLRGVIAENLKNRSHAARQAEALVEAHAREFARWMEARDSAETIRALRAKARDYRDEVLDKARRKLAAGAPADEVLAYVADTLSNKLLHAPSAKLRETDAIEQALLLNSVQKLFDLPEN
ncbi:MAG: glutamyl-tRNA reductase [Gammaproteobacteria bacterium]|nr:glutamyl-tRNA reductase [Gammaproteobacteria bacterium]